ncbi:MAG: HAD-IA family hydrolase, partial [Nanoarchaeota archaeon]|nr:HAD-IA family hydrolase [Nanoarchaeota archaeon]
CNALETGQNFKSSIVSKAYSDFYYNNIDRIYRHTFVDAAGLGDLFVTTMSEHSRNQRFGFLLGCGKSIQEAKIEIGQTIEGWDNISRFLEKKHVPDHIIDENLLHVFRNISEETPDKGRLFTLLRDYLGKIKIKAIVTDWGGVLTKDLYVGKAAKLLADKYGLDAGKLAAYLDRTEKRLLRGEETFEDYYHRVNRFGFSLEEFRDAYQNAYTKNQEMVELLIRFRKKMKVYILSNNYDFLMMKMKKDYGGICDDMFFSNEIGAIKPDTKIFMALLEKTRLRPQQCIFIDDVEENIDAARELNFNAVLFKDVNQCRNDIRKIIRM